MIVPTRPNLLEYESRAGMASSRVQARLRGLSADELAELCAQIMHEQPLASARTVEALLAKRTPLPQWAVTDVLTSEDLMPNIFALLSFDDLAKKAKGLKKKIKQIDELAAKVAGGLAPSDEQRDKLSRKPGLETELAAVEALM